MSGRIAPFRLLLLLACSLWLAACSRLDLAYRNLDLIIPWWISNFVSLDDQQKSWLEPRLQKHLTWHCSTQLPDYVAWLEQLDQMSRQPRLTPSELQGQMAQIREAMQGIAVEITPTVLGLAESLTPTQMGELYVSMDERNAELRAEHAAPPLKTQVQARAQRMRKRIEDWLGPLRPTQQARIDTWAKAQGDYNRIWAANRESWQRELRNTLYGRHTPDFSRRLTLLLQQPEASWAPAYRKAYPAVEQALASLLADLFNSTDERQRSVLRERIGELGTDLKGLECYPG